MNFGSGHLGEIARLRLIPKLTDRYPRPQDYLRLGVRDAADITTQTTTSHFVIFITHP
jgi:hypothetical protein